MAHASAKTSRNIIPSAFKGFVVGPVNLDIGGGKYDTATEFLKEKNITNLVYDPFNRSAEHNQEVMSQVITNGCDTITCLNVLNVIQQDERIEIYNHIKSLLESTNCKTVILQTYAGNGSGIAEFTDDVNQNNLTLTHYFREALEHFASYRVEKIPTKYVLIQKDFD